MKPRRKRFQDQRVRVPSSVSPVSSLALLKRRPRPRLAMPAQGFVEAFLGSLASKSTRRAYGAALAAWGKHLGTTPDDAATRLVRSGEEGNGLVRRWLEGQEAVGESPSLRNQRLAALRALVRFAGCPWQLGLTSVPVPSKLSGQGKCSSPTCKGTKAAPCCKSIEGEAT